jgi:hypothetical protein
MTRKGAPPAWLDLFDTNHMEHACEAVQGGIEGIAAGGGRSLQVPLNETLLAWLDAYLAAHWREGVTLLHVGAAERLHEVASGLVGKIHDGHPFDPGDGADVSARLRSAWVEFIAVGAGPRMYHDAAREWEQRAKAARAPRGRAKEFSAQVLAEWLKSHGFSHVTDDIAEALWRDFKVSARTVYRRQREARERGLLP